MKNRALIFITLLAIGNILFSCKKDSPITYQAPSICCHHTFLVNITSGIFPYDLTEDNSGNTIIIGDSNNMAVLIKLDTNGSLVWKRTCQNIHGSPVSLITLDDNSIIFTTAYTIEGPSINLGLEAYLGDNYISYPDNICHFRYEWAYESYSYSYSGKIVLNKMSAEGDLLWSNEFEGQECLGKSLEKTSAGNILLMGCVCEGKIGYPVYDEHGVFQDTVRYPMDNNNVYLYQVDPGGNLQWQKDFSGIFDNDYTLWNGRKNLVYTDSYIAISTDQYFLLLDHNGNEISRVIPVSPYCNNQITSLTKADGDCFYVTGYYSWYDQSNSYGQTYFAKINSSGHPFWSMALSGYVTHITDKTVAINNGTFGAIYSNSGSLILQSDFMKAYCITGNCMGGIVSVRPGGSGMITVTKTNSYGALQ